MSGLRVLFVIPGGAQGSSMVFARRQAGTLAAHGVTVESFYLQSRTSLHVLAREALRFRRHLRDFSPDLVHAHFGTMTAFFAVLVSGRVPTVITFRGSDLNAVPSSRGIRSFTGRLLSQFAALRAPRTVCVSGKLREQLWWRRGKAAILPSGVDTSIFGPMPRDAARAALEWNHSAPVVLFNAGHDARNKRRDLAQAAFDLLKAKLPNARLEVLAGGVPPERIPLYMNAADCLLLTSDAEGSPTVVQEAIATGLPVVSVDVGDVAERLRGVSCTSIVGRDAAALAAAMLPILTPPRRSDGRLRSKEIDASHIADELVHLYRETIALRSPKRISAWNTTLSSQS